MYTRVNVELSPRRVYKVTLVRYDMVRGRFTKYPITLWIKRLLSFLIGFAIFLAFLGVALYSFSTVINTFFPTQSNFEILRISISAASVFVTLVFYLGLLYLYRQMKNLQQMERRPLLEVARYSIEGDSVEVWLSNYGKGSATGLELEFELTEPNPAPIEIEPEKVPLSRRDEDQIRRDTSIPPESDYIQFRATPALNIKDENGETRTFKDWSGAVERLANAEIDEVKYYLRVHYSNQMNEPDLVTITKEGRRSDVTKFATLEESSHGIPLPVIDSGDFSAEVKIVEPVGELIKNERLGDSSKKILQKITRNNGSLPLADIGIFQDPALEEGVCEQLVYYELLEKTEPREDIATPTGPVDKPAEYEITDKGREYLNRIDF